jgi:hypothetical protein
VSVTIRRSVNGGRGRTAVRGVGAEYPGAEVSESSGASGTFGAAPDDGPVG